MKRISGWQTSDEQTFATRAEAERHETELELRQWFEDAIVGASYPVDAMTRAAVNDAPFLRRLFTRLAPIRRPRGSKAPRPVAEAAE